MKQVRSTNAKSSILSLIKHSKVALSQLEVQKMVNDLCDRVTIYRILDRLVQEKEVHKIVGLDGILKYAICNGCSEQHSHNHVHFSCEQCKSVTCLEHVVPQFEMPNGYQLKEINFTVAGLCPNCI